MGVQIGLKDEDGGHAVHGGGTFGNAQFGFTEQAIGLDRSQALIPEMNRQSKALAKVLGKGGDLFRLAALGAAHAQRVSNHDFADIVIANGAIQELKIGALVLAANGLQSLGGDAERIGHCHADGLGADIQTEDTAVRGVRRLVRNGRGGVLLAGHSYIIGANI